jgi:Nucleoside 2-deoxyribosyltransferase
MDRDQVNCLHYLYQGSLSQGLNQRLSLSQLFNADLVWCSGDTSTMLLRSGLLQVENDAVSLPDWGVVFIHEVEAQLRSGPPRPDYAFGYPFSAAIRKPGEARPAFLAIPYEPVFESIKTCVLDCARLSNFQCEITGDLARAGDIMDQVWQGIRGADVVIADVTGNNANVMMEVGMAVALGKEVMVLGEGETLPFDIRQWRKFTYNRRDLQPLRDWLMAAFRSVSARYPYEGKEPHF